MGTRRWEADQIYMRNFPSWAKEQIRGYLRKAPLIDVDYDRHVQALKKTQEERHIILAIQQMINVMLSRINAPRIRGLERYIRVVDQKEYTRVTGLPEGSAHCRLRMAYVPRISKVKFIEMVAHEAFHVIAYQGVAYALERPEVVPENLVRVPRREGYSFVDSRGYHPRRYFLGLNEAVTDCLKGYVLGFLAEDTDVLTKDEFNLLVGHSSARMSSYMPQLLLLRAIIARCAAEDEQVATTMTHEMLSDYVRGTMLFLKRVERTMPGAVRILRDMGEAPEDALRPAQLLHLDGVVQDIEWVLRAMQRAEQSAK